MSEMEKVRHDYLRELVGAGWVNPVRCKDCRRSMHTVYSDYTEEWNCAEHVFDGDVDPTGYCSLGEARDERD